MRVFIRVGRVLGIPVGINPSWFVLLALIVAMLATQIYPEVLPRREAWEYWALAGSTALVFFMSLVLHELGHSVVARAFGIPVRSITLFILGAVAQTARETRRPGQEFLMAVAGPVVSILIAGVFMVLWFLTGRGENTVSRVCEWLWLTNVIVGVFNLAPAFPMDGGRVLRAALWGATGNYRLATRVAAGIGQGLAALLIGVGVLTVLGLPPLDQFEMITGAQFVLLGLFLGVAARQSDAQSGVLAFLSAYRVADVMLRDVPAVYASTTIRGALAGPLAGWGESREWLFVSDTDRFAGVTNREMLRRVPESAWDSARVGDFVIPSERTRSVRPDEPLSDVIQGMDADETPLMVVVDGGNVVGLIHRGLLSRLVQRREASAHA